MTNQEFLMPQMGESITEATILSWAKSEGDIIEEDETLLEIATDKVDSELPSPFSGKIIQLLYKEGDVVEVGSPIAIIATDKVVEQDTTPVVPIAVKDQLTQRSSQKPQASDFKKTLYTSVVNRKSASQNNESNVGVAARPSMSKRFYSPLVRAIAQSEQLGIDELDRVVGSGREGRVTKSDVVNYVRQRAAIIDKNSISYTPIAKTKKSTSVSGDVEIIEMDRTRRLIADHMVRSKHTSPHVTSFLEIDITSLVEWREQVKDEYYQTYGEKITYTPIFIYAIAKAIKDFPAINASVEGYNILLKKSINIGMATATATGNLIVPVIRDADHFDMHGLVTSVNDLANRARHGHLKPDDTQGGTFTLTNVGTFGNTMGTPIINQPQAAILSVGAIRKKPGVVESPDGDRIEIRKFMFLSLSYDHRIVDGSLGGQFLRRVGDYLEGFVGM